MGCDKCGRFNCPHNDGTEFTRREKIIATVMDLAAHLSYYDRKEDHFLPMGEIEAAIAAGEITLDEIVEQFKVHLKQELES